MDFTTDKYKELLDALVAAGFETVSRFAISESACLRQVILRHDVDLHPERSLQTARIEASKGLHAIYYFRAVPESWDDGIIKEIASLGHEIGYHYESLTTCCGDIDAAYQDFCSNLHKLNDLIGVPMKTICMHGSPRSSYDSRDLWKHYDYHTLGIDYEPYFDTDFSKTFYLTDTGRRWDGYKVSVRDKIPEYQDRWTMAGLIFHSTEDIINDLSIPNSKLLTQNFQLLITTHPQRWMPFSLPWVKEFFLQNLKNMVKFMKTRP